MIDLLKEHLVILRSYGEILNLKTYNCQELGLAKALVKKGLKVSFLMPGNVDKIEEIHTVFGKVVIVHIRIKWKLHNRYCWFDNLEEKLQELQPTLLQVHDMDLLMTWRAVRWAKNKKIPCFLIQGPYDTWRKPFFRQLNEIYNCTFGKYIIKNVTRIGVKTELASHYLKKYFSCKTFKISIGLDIELFEKSDKIDWRKKLGIENKKVLLYVGSLQQRRNPMFMLDIINVLSDDYVLLIVGTGIQEKNVREKIQKLGLTKKCMMLGRRTQKELPSLYSSADCFLLVSDYEILGMVIMEAMYFGLPVISTNTTGASYIIRNKETGLIINNKNLTDWVENINHLFADKNEYSNMCELGKRDILNRFIWDETSKGFLDLYFN